MRRIYRLQNWAAEISRNLPSLHASAADAFAAAINRMAVVVFASAFVFLAACSPDAPQERPITWDQYEQIIPGMSYTEVVKIVGQNGEEKSSIDLDGKTVRTYEFSSPTGNFLVQFADNIVMNKIPGTIKAPPLSTDQ